MKWLGWEYISFRHRLQSILFAVAQVVDKFVTACDLVKDFWDGLNGSGKGCVVVVVIIGNHWTYIRLTPDPHACVHDEHEPGETNTDSPECRLHYR